MFIIIKIKGYWLILPRGFRHFMKYSIVGTTNMFVDFLTYWSLTRTFGFFGEHYLLANGCAFMVASVWGFIWNKNWSFENKENGRLKQYSKYFTVTFVGLILSETVLYFLVSSGMYDMFAKLCVVAIACAWNFTMNKYWTFKEKF